MNPLPSVSREVTSNDMKWDLTLGLLGGDYTFVRF